ncbi:MAG: (Fe-S)-binding protein, partial [Mailhella sp.]|nr:(Fe-S)-binding protein [Mailhella sp.]
MSSEDGQLCTVDVNTLRPMPVDYETYEWKVITDAQKQQYCCLLDDINVLLIPVPQTKAEEEEMVNRFLDGVRKLFTPENNWTCLAMLDTTMDYCAQCNSCSAACHLYEMSGEHEMYRPNFRSEIFRRIYKQYVKKEPLAKWRYGDMDLNWKTVVRLAELAYRCNLCRRCAQVCPIGIDNGLIARELRKMFSQEFGWNPRELHEKGTKLQLEVGSSTGMNGSVVQETVEFIDEDYVEMTGYEFK